jgi:hypothetical protein
VGELVAKLHRVQRHRSKLERPAVKICDLLLGPPPRWAWLADNLEEVARCLRVELEAWRDAEAMLEALQSSMVWVRVFVLGDADGSSNKATSLPAVAELLVGRIDTVAAKEVHWGSRSMLVAAISHFPELDVDLKVLGSSRSVGLTEDEVDALWSLVRTAVDLLTSHVPSSVAHNPHDGVGK